MTLRLAKDLNWSRPMQRAGRAVSHGGRRCGQRDQRLCGRPSASDCPATVRFRLRGGPCRPAPRARPPVIPFPEAGFGNGFTLRPFGATSVPRAASPAGYQLYDHLGNTHGPIFTGPSRSDPTAQWQRGLPCFPLSGCGTNLKPPSIRRPGSRVARRDTQRLQRSGLGAHRPNGYESTRQRDRERRGGQLMASTQATCR
jgi:hypothetical protein